MSATGGAGGATVTPAANEGRTDARKVSPWQVACINWSHADAPHAVAYYNDGGTIAFTRYFGEWPDAIEWAQRTARRFAK
jgi:hypothetical protein